MVEVLPPVLSRQSNFGTPFGQKALQIAFFVCIQLGVSDLERIGNLYYGKNYKYGLKLASIMAPQGFIIELHEILDDNPSTYNEFIKEHGYGVHHLGFAVGDRRDAVVNELIDRGYQKRVEHIYPTGSWTIIDSDQSLGVNLNIKPAM